DAAAPSIPWTIRVAGEATAPDGSTRSPANVALMGRPSGDALIDWMERASIFALPARHEPFGLAALEAAQCGCALVLGDIESQREVWDDGALFVAPDDSGELAATLRRLIDDSALRASMAARAFARAQRYSPVAMAAAYAREYHSLANANANAKVNPNAHAGSGHAAAAAHLTT